MKKNLKVLSAILLAFLIIATPIKVNAEEMDELGSNIIVVSDSDFNQTAGDNTVIDVSGNFLQFETKEEMDLYLKAQNQQKPNSQLRSFYGYTSTSKVVGTKYYSKIFVGFNSQTPSWSKASSYAINKSYSTSISASLKYDSTTFSVSATASSGVTTTIPADSKRYSKLGFLADIKATKLEIKIYYNGVLQSTSYPVQGTITTTYNTVKYQ